MGYVCRCCSAHAFYGIHVAEGAAAHVLEACRNLHCAVVTRNRSRLAGETVVQKEGRVVNAEKVMPLEIG